MVSTYPYARCNGPCGQLRHIDELGRIEGNYGEFGEKGTIYLCEWCVVDWEEEEDEE